MAWKYNDRIIRVGRSWTDDNGVTHPRNWAIWANDEKTAAGLVWEDDPASFDSRFYWSADLPKALDDRNEVDDETGEPILDADGNQVVTKGLKSQAIAQTKVTANAKLADTDWMVVKATEIADYSVPADVLTYRAAVRTASNSIESAISGAANHAAFMALYDTPVDADGNVTGNAPINDWPEEI
jgi:hypothetical protein